MAAEGKNRRPESANFRIWPGVVLIAVCAFLLFLAVYVVAYRANLIPLPEYLKGLFDHNGSEQTAVAGETELQEALMPEMETENGVYYFPAGEDPQSLLQALQTPQQYRHRIRITRTRDSVREISTAEIYVQEDCWKLTVTPEKGTAEVYLCSGSELYRKNNMLPEGATMAAGKFTPANLLGLPTLSDLKQAEADVQIREEDKILLVSYEMADGMNCVCRVGLDSGLLIEVQLMRDGETLLVMYTELFDLAPEEFLQNDFFSIPKTEEQNQ